MGADVSIDRVDEYAGLHRHLEVGLCIAPTRAAAVAAAKGLAAFLDEQPTVPVRLAALAVDPSRVLITVAVTLGDIDDIKTAGAGSRSAVVLLQRIVDELASYDPAFVALPAPTSAPALLAARVAAGAGGATVLSAVRQLSVVG
jgi:hypothetical protein